MFEDVNNFVHFRKKGKKMNIFRTKYFFVFLILSNFFLYANSGIDLYIDLLERTILNTIYEPSPEKDSGNPNHWPTIAHSMIGRPRMDNVVLCCKEVIHNNIPGDFVETGVWRGGTTILMRGILKAYGIKDRTVWVCDSFEGLPKVDVAHYPIDAIHTGHHTIEFLKVSLDQVKNNFKLYGLLDDQVKFLKGWFKDTMPKAPIRKIAVLRLDGDLYESTIQVLQILYDRVSVGGYIIIDDFCLDAARAATNDFRKSRNIQDQLIVIDNCGVYWKKTR